jgi:SAM-dependent methyltransferase
MIIKRWLFPIIDFRKAIIGLREYLWFFKSWYQYSRMPDAEKISLSDVYPCLYDRTSKTGIDPHYFYQGVWAMRSIKNSGETEHVDVGSLVSFVGLLSTIVKLIFIDIRPAPVVLENFESRAGSILALPFEDGTIRSLSCLHVAEHIGLGRYGDPLDPLGTRKAAKELTRVLAGGGHLYFSLPVGEARVQFNAHRIHSPDQILEYFSGLELVSFSAVTDKGKYSENIEPSEMEHARYACGMFHFTKKRRV